MTWQRTLDIGGGGVRVTVDENGYVELGAISDGDLLTPIEATELADVLKRAARFAARERELAASSRRRSA